MKNILKKLVIFIGFTCILLINNKAAYASENISTLDEMQNVILQGLMEHDDNIAFTYKGDKTEFVSNVSTVIRKAYTSNSYIERSWTDISPNVVVKKNGIEVEISVSYLTTENEENIVDEEINRIANEISISNKTAEQKIKAVNDYLVSRFEYDNTYSSNNAYTALTTNKTVCQGYSMTAYKLLNKLNVPCEISVGSLNGVSHSWNKVNINGAWHYLDITSNDTTNSNRYLIVNEITLINNGYVMNLN